MLIKREHLDGIKSGAISLLFRRWRRPTVKAGGRLRTAVGVLAIEDVVELDEGQVGDRDARAGGFSGRDELIAELAKRGTGQLYQIRVSFAGEDERIALRNDGKLGKEALAELVEKLDRFDKNSRRGPWTRQILELIRRNPEVRAEDLARKLGTDKPWFKRNVRKLKELGLTESLSPGYRLSPRGERVAKHLLGGS